MSIELTYKNIQYGQLVEYHHPKDQGGYHSGVRVHFFNRKGVLIGNYYEFVPYDQLRVSEVMGTYWPRMYMDKPLEGIRQFIYEQFCRIHTVFIKTIESIDFDF